MNKILLIFSGLTIFGFQSTSINPLENKGIEAGKLDGYWLSNDYLNLIENSKSIYVNSDYTTKYWGFTLEKDNLLSEIAWLNGFTLHEGGYGCFLRYNNERQLFEHDLSKDEQFSYLSGVPFELQPIDSSKLMLKFKEKQETYRKVQDDQYAFREILLTGKYQDLNHNGAIIEFKNDGHVSGINKRQYVELVYDFQLGIDYDACVFYSNNNETGNWTNGDLYNFVWQGDTLSLYKIKTDWEDLNHQIGELDYLLKRL